MGRFPSIQPGSKGTVGRETWTTQGRPLDPPPFRFDASPHDPGGKRGGGGMRPERNPLLSNVYPGSLIGVSERETHGTRTYRYLFGRVDRYLPVRGGGSHRWCRPTPEPMRATNPTARTRICAPARAYPRTWKAGMDLEPYLRVANEVADAAANVTLRHFRTGVNVETKKDESPVTVADREAESMMREIIATALPKHGVFGEEFGLDRGGESDFLWVLDPIDGTKSFITGKPVFGTLISMLYRGKPVLGIIDQPVLKERWVGAWGSNTTLNGREINTRKCAQLSDAYLYATSPSMFSGRSAEAFGRLCQSVRIPLYGCDCYAYGLLSAGHCDVVAEADMKPYDYMALVPIVEGAGGVMTDWSGKPLMGSEEGLLDELPGEVIAAGDAISHTQALSTLDW